MGKMGAVGKAYRSKYQKVVDVAMSTLLISTLVFQLFRVSTASSNHFLDTYDSQLWSERELAMDREYDSYDVTNRVQHYHHTWRSAAAVDLTNWSITVTDTGLGAAVQVVYLSLPAKLDAEISASIEGKGANKTVKLKPVGNGGYTAYLSAGTPGEYKVIVTEGSAVIGDPTYTVHVAEPPSAFTSKVIPCLSPMDTGAACEIQVTAIDGAGVPRTTPGKICPFKIKIWDEKGQTYLPHSIIGPVGGDGNCNITFIPLRSRTYTARVTLDGRVLTVDGQFNITAKPAATAESNFMLESPNVLADGSYGVGAALFNIRNKQPTYKGIHGFTINIVSPNLTLLRTCLDIRTSPECSFIVNVTKLFTFKIDVLLDNTTALSTSIAAAKFSAGFIEGSSSRISVTGNQSALVAGADSPAYDVSLLDEFGNPAGNYSTGDYETVLVVDLVTPDSLPCAQHFVAVIAAGLAPGIYTATFKNLTCAGNYTVRAYFGHASNVIEGSGIDLVVEAGVADPLQSKLFLNTSLFTAGGSIGVVAFVGDAWGNPVLTADVAFTLANTDKSVTGNYTATLAGSHFEGVIGSGITIAGAYELAVLVGGTSLVTGSVNCTASRFSAERSNFTIAVNFTTGIVGNFTLDLLDAYDNPIGKNRGPLMWAHSGVVHLNGSAASRLKVASNDSSKLELQFRQDIAGPYKIKLPYNRLFPGSTNMTMDVIVYPSAIDGFRSSITGPALGGGVAGTNFTVYIIPRDAFGNVLEANAVDMASVVVAVTVTDRASPSVNTTVTADALVLDVENGRYISTFNATASGTCIFQITATTVGRATFTIRPASFSGEKSVLSGMGLKGSVVNQPATFFINAKDGFGNAMDDLGSGPVEFQATLCKVGAICVNVTECSDDCKSAGRIAVRDRHMYGGFYAVIWSTPTTGTYSITLTSGNQNITGSPVTGLSVITLSERGPPTALEAMVCEGLIFKTWCPGYFGSAAGVKARFTVALADDKQNFVASSGTALSIALTPADPTAVTEIIDTNDGYYTIVYTITKIPDPPAPIAFAVNLGASAVTTANLAITPAWTSALKSTIEPVFTALLVAGQALYTQITPKDAYGNTQIYREGYAMTNDKFGLVCIRDTGERVHAEVSWNTTDLKWDLSLTLIWSGSYYVSVQLNDVPLGTTGATATITVEPGTPTIENSVLLQPWLPPIRAMMPGQFEVPTLADKYGNRIVKDLSFTANATDPLDVAATIIPLLCALTNTTYGLVTCTFSFNKTGIYNVTYGAEGLVASTNIKVLPGPAFPTSTVQGDATTNCTVGHLSTFQINCLDQQGNNCTQASTAFKAYLYPEEGQTNITAGIVTADIYDTPLGTMASYIVKEVGNWTLNVTLMDGTNITGSPFTVACVHAFSTPSISFAYVVDPPRKLDNVGKVAFVAGTSIKLGVMILDRNGNKQNSAVKGDALTVVFEAEDNTIPGTGAYLSPVVNNDDATFSLSVSATKVGLYDKGVLKPITYLLKVTCTTFDEPSLVDQNIGGAPYSFVVLPDVISTPSTSVVLVASNPDMTGLTSTFRILTQDAYGNIAAYNQTLNVSAMIMKYEPPTVTDETVGAPVVPSPARQSRRILQVAPSQVTTPQETGGYTITPLVINNFDGTYSFTFSVTKAGPYNISVYIDSELVGSGGPTIQDFVVNPGSPDFARLFPVSETLGKNSAPLPAATAGNLTIAIADMFSNPTTIGNTAATLYSANITANIQLRVPQVNAYQVYEDTASNVTLDTWTIDATDGTITSKYTPTSSGMVAFYMWFGDTVTNMKYLSAMTPVMGQIISGELDVASFRVSGGGIVGAIISTCTEAGFCVVLNNTVEIEMFDLAKNRLDPSVMAATCANITTEYNVTEGLLTMVPVAAVSRSGYTCIVKYSVADTNLTTPISFNISYADTKLTGSPWTVPLRRKNGDVNIAKSFAWGDLGGAIESGKSGIVVVQLVDKEGVWFAGSPLEGNEYIQLVVYNQTEGVVSPTLTAEDNLDGTFTLTYETSATGSFGLQVVVGFNLRPLGNVFVVRVVASETVVGTASVSLTSTNVTVYRAGKDAVIIEVQASDQYTNLQDYYFASPDMFQAKIVQPDGTTAYRALDRVITETPFGVPYHKWVLNFIPEQAPAKSSTLYTFSILWSNGTSQEMVPSAPIKINTMPGPPAATNIQVLGQGASRAVLGVSTSFMVVLYDALNNPVTSLSDITDYNITMVLHSLSDEELINQPCTTNAAPPGGICSYTIPDEGTYVVDVWANLELQFQQSIMVQPAAIYAPNCRAYGDGVGTTDSAVISGIQTEFIVDAFDILNNTLTASALSNVTTTFDVSGYNLLSTGVIRPAPGYPLRLAGTNRVIVRYTVLKSGRYVVNVRRGSAHISGSPFYVDVLPGEISDKSTVDESTMSNCTAGDTHTVVLTSKDLQGNIRTRTTDTLTIVKYVMYQNESKTDVMTPKGEGVYMWNFTCLTAGTVLDPKSTQITIFSGRLSPVWTGMLPVLPGPPDPKQFLVGAFDLVKAGDIGKTTILAADAAGNILWEGGLQIIVYLSTETYNTTASGEDWYNGTYTFTWMITVAGLYSVNAALDGILFYTEELWIFPGPPVPKMTSVLFDGSTGYVAGVEGMLWIQLFDAYQNNISMDIIKSTDIHFVSMSSDPEPRRAMFEPREITHDGSKYTVKFLPLFAGVVKLHLMVNHQIVLSNGEPYSTSVIAGPPHAGHFYAWGGGWTAGGTVNGNSMFFLRMRDVMDNLIDTEPQSPLVVSFSPAVSPDAAQSYIGNGVMMVTYVPTAAAAEFTISLAYDGQAALTSGLLMANASVGNYSAARSTIMGSDGTEIDNHMVVYAVAGDAIGFLIQARDQSGMPINSPPLDQENPKIPSYVVRIQGVPTQVIESDPSTYQAAFELASTEARDYMVIVRSSDSKFELPNSGFGVKFLPGASSPPNCKVMSMDGTQFDSTKPLIAGMWFDLMAQALDEYDNVQIYNLQNPDIFVATLVAGSTTTAVGESIDFTSTYKTTVPIPTIAGAGTLTVTLNGAQVVSYAILVIAANMSLAGTEITPWYLDPMISGQEAEFDITPVDMYQNVINSVNATQQVFATLAVKIKGANGAPDTYTYMEQAYLRPAILSQGLHASVMPKRVGSYIVVAANSKGRMSGDTGEFGIIELATVDILPGIVDITRSFATIEPAYLAGSTITFQVTGLDSYNNLVPMLPIVTTDPYYNVMVTPAVCSPEQIAANLSDPCVPLYTADVMFTPHSYGELNITITWDGVNEIEHLVMMTARGAPTILTAVVSDTGSSIIVTFEGVTDAGLKSLRGTRNGLERCEMLLDNATFPKLGTNPECGFKDYQTMFIQLGYDATLSPAGTSSPDWIGLSDGGVFATHETSLPVTGSVLLRPPDKHPALVAMLAAPTMVGACDDFKLDASASYGGAGRPMTFTYHVKGTGDLLKLAALGSVLEAISNETMVVVIPAGSLEANHIYTFVVVVLNYYGKRATASATVAASVTPVPILNIPGSAEIQTFMRGQMVTLEANAVIPGWRVYDLVAGSCSPVVKMKANTTANQMLFHWTQISGPYANLALMGSTARTLNIPGNQLMVGEVYTFGVTVSMVGFQNEYSTAMASVQVKSSPLMTFVMGGDRAVNASQDLILEAVAYDPDDLVDSFGNALPFRFVWTCDTPITIPESILYVYTDHHFGSKIRIPADTLINGTTYNYTVTVTKEGAGEAATGNVSIWSLENTVAMTCAILNSDDLFLGVYSSSQLTIACTPGFESYNWTMVSDGDQRLLWELDPVVVIEGSIKIPPHQLLAARSYKIMCEGRTKEGMIGTASVSFTTALLPSGGTATLTQNTKNNMAGKTLYRLVAHGWMAGVGGGQLLYEFRYTYKSGKNIREIILQPLSTSNSVSDFVLLGGMITLKVYVCDSGTPRIHSNDAPAGSMYMLPPMKVSGKGRRSLLQSQSFPNSYWTIANQGKYFNALTAMELLGYQSMNSQSGGCASSNRALVGKMVDSIILNGNQVPAATSEGGATEGSGPTIALKTACVIGKLYGKGGNANNVTQFEAVLDLFLRDLRLVADFGLNVGMQRGQPYDPCFYDAGNAFLQIAKSACYRKGVSYANQDRLILKVSVIPNLIARVIVSDVGFRGPHNIKRRQYTAAGIRFPMSVDVYSEPNQATGTVLNLNFMISSTKPGGVPIGAAVGCFANSPLKDSMMTIIKKILPFEKLVSVCDVSFTGHTDGDWAETTIRGSFIKLSKLNKKNSYVPLMLVDDVPKVGILKNVLSNNIEVSFDFVRAMSRIILVTVKGSNFTTAPAPPPPPTVAPVESPPPPSANATTKALHHYGHPIKMTRIRRSNTGSSRGSRGWTDDQRPRKYKMKSRNSSRNYFARFWRVLFGRS